MAEPIRLISKEMEEQFHVKIDYVIIHCTNPDCIGKEGGQGHHWGISLSNRPGHTLTKRDFICEKCAAKRESEI